MDAAASAIATSNVITCIVLPNPILEQLVKLEGSGESN